MTNKWAKSISRDVLALGGIPFYIIVMARATIGEFQLFINQLLLAIVILYVLQFVVKQTNLHLARGFILFVFISFFYRDLTFAVSAFLLWLAALAAAFYLQTKVSSIIKGIILGVASAAAAYYFLL